MQERDITVEGEFLSDQQMIDEGISEYAGLNKYHAILLHMYSFCTATGPHTPTQACIYTYLHTCACVYGHVTYIYIIMNRDL